MGNSVDEVSPVQIGIDATDRGDTAIRCSRETVEIGDAIGFGPEIEAGFASNPEGLVETSAFVESPEDERAIARAAEDHSRPLENQGVGLSVDGKDSACAKAGVRCAIGHDAEDQAFVRVFA